MIEHINAGDKGYPVRVKLNAAIDKVNEQDAAIAAVASEADTALSTHNTATGAHADIREAIGNEATARAGGDAATLEDANDYTDERVAALRTDAMVWKGTVLESQLPTTGMSNGDYYWLSDFDVTYPNQGKKGSATWTVPAQGAAFWDKEVDAYHEPDGETIEGREGDGALQVKDDGITDAKLGNRTITATATDDETLTGALTTLLSSLSGRIKALLARFHATTGHKHNGTDSPKVAYGDLTGTPTIPTPYTLPTASGTVLGGVKVGSGLDIDANGILSSSGGSGGESMFTFVVDSNEALAAWANNTAGNDYSHVLIKKGTWTSDSMVFLTNTGTKVVVGQAGSLLSFTSSIGLRYQTVPTTLDYWMLGVSVQTEVSDNGFGFFNCTKLTNCTNIASNGYSKGFFGCTKLTNCTSTVNSNNLQDGFSSCTDLTNCTGTGTFFSSCTNLTNCTVTSGNIQKGFSDCTNLTNCTSTGTYGFYRCTKLTNCTGSSVTYGFSDCTNLTNCTSTGTGSVGFNSCTNLANCTGTGTGGGFNTGFSNCTKLTNCTGSGSGTYDNFGFNNCTDLANCTGTGTGSGSFGFSNCTKLTNCTGTGTGSGFTSNGYGFRSCTNLTNCTGDGTCTADNPNNKGYGFYDCRIMQFCKPGSTTSTLGTYYSCYMHATGTDDPVGDTAEGGWNMS